MPLREVGGAALDAFQEQADEELRRQIVPWARKDLAFLVQGVGDSLLEARVKATQALARRLELKTQREIALLYAVLQATHPRLGVHAIFQDTLRRLTEKQRTMLLYDILTGSPLPVLADLGPMPAADDDWSSFLAA